MNNFVIIFVTIFAIICFLLHVTPTVVQKGQIPNGKESKWLSLDKQDHL
jgi:hypothetical protein